MSLDHSPTGSLIEYSDDIEEAMSPNRSVAAVAVKDGDASVYKIIHGFLKQKNNSIIRVAAKVAKKAASNK
jgi:GDP-mannose transporter